MEGVISESSINLYDSHWNDNVYSQEAATSVQWITTPEQPQVPFYNEMLHEQISYSYICEGGIALQSALQDIYQCPIIAVDCEGFELGRDGILCLIQIATDSHVYIFDVLSLGTTLFDQGLRYILENPIPTKVFYDCRRDSDILYYHFGVKLKGVLDVALTEVFYRWKNGHGSPRFLKGYKRCVESYLCIENPHFFQVKERIGNRMNAGDTQFWLQRPLPMDAIEYSAYDVKYLRELHFVLTQSMSTKNIRCIYEASEKFVGMERDLEDVRYSRNSPKWAEITPSLFGGEELIHNL
jgi:exonuclease 3'-5' domain-containing protein 1